MPEPFRIALITGANKGIGLETARRLGQAGLRVLLGARKPTLGEAAAAMLASEGLDAHFIHIDLNALETLTSAASAIETEFGRLDVLVNNAGITDRADGSPEHANPEAVRRIFDTNVLGSLAVTQTMLPLLRRSASGRIVNLSSGLGSITLNSDPDWEFAGYKLFGYNASKAALNMLTVHLAAELAPIGIKANSADPGFTATDLNGHRGTQNVEEGTEIVVRLALLPDDGPTGGFFSKDRANPW